MLNFTKMEVKRLFKQKAAYVTLLTMSLIFIAVMVVLHINLASIKEDTSAIEKEATSETTDLQPEAKGDSVTVKMEVDDDLDFLTDEDKGEAFIISEYAEAGVLIFLIIFGSLFFTLPYQHGFIKNFIGLRKDRTGYLGGQYLSFLIFVFLSFLVSGALIYIGSYFIQDGFLEIKNHAGVLRLAAVHFYIHCCFMAFLLLVATLTKSMASTLSIVLVYAAVLHRALTGIMTTLINKLVTMPESFHIADYTIIGNMNRLQWGVDGATINHALIVATVIALASLIGSRIILNRSDI